jgi:acetyltransferase
MAIAAVINCLKDIDVSAVCLRGRISVAGGAVAKSAPVHASDKPWPFSPRVSDMHETMPMHIQSLCTDELVDELGTFIDLLTDAVAGGASLGFIAPVPREAARRYWLSLRDEIRAGTRLLLVARAHGRIVGTGQLALPAWPNARHRAEVQKLVIDASMRGLGIGQQLMGALHQAAQQHGRSLVLLGTRHGGRPQAFYERLGYRVAGVLPGHTIDADGRRHDSATLYIDLTARTPSDAHAAMRESLTA